MSKLRQKQQWRNFTRSKILLAVLVLLTIFSVRSVYERYTVERDMAARRAAIEAELSELEARRAALSERVDYLSNERGIEAEVRRQFDVAREGEQVVIILDDTEPLPEIAGAATTTTPERPWYRFW
ncbi:MAG: septum formation initiator family protein [Patescibacteria group bacterium]